MARPPDDPLRDLKCRLCRLATVAAILVTLAAVGLVIYMYLEIEDMTAELRARIEGNPVTYATFAPEDYSQSEYEAALQRYDQEDAEAKRNSPVAGTTELPGAR